ncbi:hypothetical protein K474DRAFT_1611884 [Panus rudis PR-1116 ss-1]|nr:hypothetical protein K474DRAFT_1611884 [Panus rudis PR-1116 ss-1]
MSAESHLKRGHPILFGLMIFFGIIELAISAWLVSRFNAHHNYLSLAVRDRTRFILFTSIWTIVVSFLFIGFFRFARGSIFASVGSHGVVLFLTWLFWTAAAASITAAYAGGLDCGGDGVVYCGQQNAQEAFAWVEWILSTLALFTVIIRGIISARRGDGLGGELV